MRKDTRLTFCIKNVEAVIKNLTNITRIGNTSSEMRHVQVTLVQNSDLLDAVVKQLKELREEKV